LIVAIIQARMDSTRLPGKAMLKVCEKPLLEHMVDRVLRSKKIEKIIVATTTNKIDDVIVEFCKLKGIDYFRGSREDVLGRYKQAADYTEASIIVRLTSDCPLIDPKIIDRGINIYLNNNYDFVSNITPLPRTYPIGMDVEIFSYQILTKTDSQAKKPSEREHVTFFVRKNPKDYKIFRFDYKENLSNFRLVIDYFEDFEVMRSILEELYPKNQNFTLEDIIKWAKQNPKIIKKNQKIISGQGWNKSFEEDKKLGFISHLSDENYI